MPSAASIEDAFNLLVEAAVAGERCPQTRPHGPIQAAAMSALYRAGRIEGLIYKHNYRVVRILTGPHAGKTTAAPARGLKPYKRIDAAGSIILTRLGPSHFGRVA